MALAGVAPSLAAGAAEPPDAGTDTPRTPAPPIERAESFVQAYNRACSLAAAGDLDNANAALARAVVLGFSDVRQLRRDPDLDPLRTTTEFALLLDQWPEILEARRSADIKRDEAWQSAKPERRTLDDLRVEVISGRDALDTDAAVEELRRVAALARAWFSEAFEPAHLAEDPWVTVVLPEPADFAAWARQTLGGDAQRGFASVGGAYDHDRRRLVAHDLGATLRHEFVHLIHWRDMSRRGVTDPLWVQEGLGTLVETLDPPADGPLWTPAACWRINSLARLAEQRRVRPVAELAGLDSQRFASSRPLARYAHARGLLLWLRDRGVLDRFVRLTRARDADADPSALRALEEACGQDAEGIDAALSEWARSLPPVAETGADLRVLLGVTLEEAGGVGVRIAERTPAANPALRPGAVITAVNARPVRDLKELMRVLGTLTPGEAATFTLRRGRLIEDARITLSARP